MRFEARVEGREVLGAELATQEGKLSSKKGKKRQRKSGAMPTVVQRLYEACKEVFSHDGAGIVPSAEDVGRIRSILDNMKPADVGLTQKLPFFGNIESSGAPPITYLHIYDCPKFSIGIFCLPPSGAIPLHNHPSMTVFSKLLVGSMHIKSYDWVDVPQNCDERIESSHFESSGRRLAKVNSNAVFTAPCETSILYPAAGGNMHCFTARTPCAVLDVLGPPYSDPEGRHCTYYSDSPYVTSSGDRAVVPDDDSNEYAWLEEREKPNNFFVVGAKYKGPKIIDR